MRALWTLQRGNPGDFERIPLGPAAQARTAARLVCPQAAYVFQLQGADPQQFTIPACPAFESADAAGEMVELYWKALRRDVPFTAYAAP